MYNTCIDMSMTYNQKYLSLWEYHVQKAGIVIHVQGSKNRT